MFCTNCGKEIDNSALFCPYCGAKAESPESAPVSDNKTQAFIDQRNAQKGIVPPAPAAPAENKTEAFIAAKQAETQAPVPPAQGYIPPQPPAGQYQAPANPAPVTQYRAPAAQPVNYGGVAPQQPYAAPVATKPKKKGLPAWAIVLIILGALAIVGTVSTLIVANIVKRNLEKLNPVDGFFSELDDWADEINSSTTAYDSDEDDETTTEATTEQTTTEATTEAQSTTEAYNPKYNSGKIDVPLITDFGWVKNAKAPSASQTFKNPKNISGKWKAYYVYSDGVKELNIITIAANETAAKVAVKPCYINYEFQWEKSPGKSYAYNKGSFSEGTVTATDSRLGTIVFYSFYAQGGKQYAFGKTMTQSGETVNIALVRP